MGKKPLNCWEFKKCGRQPGGEKEQELGTCPAATEKSMDCIHRGDNAGRSCWIIAGTFCGGKTQGTYANKMDSCAKCEFFKLVLKEEKKSAHEAVELLQVLKIVSR